MNNHIEGLYKDKRSGRIYSVITVARTQNLMNTLWTNFVVVYRGTDSNTASYCVPIERFLEECERYE